MASPLVVRLLLDAQSEFVRAADGVPEASCEGARPGLNSAAWIVAHASFFLDVWLSVDAQGRGDEACDPWLLAWSRRVQQGQPEPLPQETSFAEARAALDRAVERTAGFVGGLSDADLERVPERLEENGWPEGTTVGYLVARSVAHLFAHASELNVVATAAGAADMGLPGRLRHTFGSGNLTP